MLEDAYVGKRKCLSNDNMAVVLIKIATFAIIKT